MKTYYALQQTEQAAELYLFGDIVPFEFFEGDVSAHGIVQEIKNLTVPQINVHIDSRGGAVSEGWAIYNALRQHPAQVNTYGDGFVASAALFPFLAGDNRYASNISGYYLHQVIIGVEGYADDLRAAANDADTMTEIGVQAFVERAGMEAETVRQLMKNETWLTPSQALEYGIATAILADETPKYLQDGKKQIFAALFGKQKQETPPPKPPEQKQEQEQEQEAPANGLMKTLGGFFMQKNKEESINEI